jgi:hypothetical protein
MIRKFDFGWRVPDLGEALSGNKHKRAKYFRDQIFSLMDIIHDHFDPTWAGNHFSLFILD